MIDRVALLGTLKPLVGVLEDSIRERVDETPELAEHLALEHSRALTAERTAMSLEEWREGEFTQAAVAWVLGCVFVRFLEDNGLIEQPLISGPGERRAAALGHREEYFRVHPAHSDREYLEACFRKVAAHPTVAALYDERHNPLWRLGPTADGARVLRETFAAIDPDSGLLEHGFADAGLDTRFVGDLYQDLSEAAKKRYALLQTPEFVEEFILDRTLDPAIDEFGLEEVRLIDPTCGSGHFLIGAFVRLFARWQDREPGTEQAVLAQRCLDQIAGVDLNPYATAIARFRLIIAALQACGITRLAEAPAFHLNLATGDSLLHGPLPADGASMLFDANRLNQNIAHVFESEDAAELKRILGRGYHAVVGNPPYIAVQDSALRDAYRARYASCHGQYVLTVPFMERFFELAQIPDDNGSNRAGFVGKITGNNFMKREFGVPLVEKFLPSVDVQTVIDTSGAYIPGHGTPTVILFGRGRPPQQPSLRVVDGIRREPGQVDDPSRGRVWSSICDLVDAPGEASEYVRSTDIPRAELLSHPMMLGVGRDLLRRIRASGGQTLNELVTDVGSMSATREDAAYVLPRHAAHTRRIAPYVAPVVGGDVVRDWVCSVSESIIFPYEEDLAPADGPPHRIARLLWPNRTALRRRLDFGGSMDDRGLEWFEFSRFVKKRFGTDAMITWGEITSHNHFALVPDGAVCNMTSPVMSCAPGTPVRRYQDLLGLLNSSVSCFWLKQVCQPKGAHLAQTRTREERYAFNAENVREVPVPRVPVAGLGAIGDLAAHLTRIASERDRLTELIASEPVEGLAECAERLRACDDALTRRLVSLQEELDWSVLRAYGLVPDDLPIPGADAPPITLGQRAFEIVLARQVACGQAETSWFGRHGSTPVTEVPAEWPAEYRDVVERRVALIGSDPDVSLIERPENKRRWNRVAWEDRQREALAVLVLDALEDHQLWADLRPRSTAELTDVLRVQPVMVEALELLSERKDADLAATVRRLVTAVGVPQLAAQRLTEKGLRKRAVWERVWDLQRAEDRIDARTALPETDPARLSRSAATELKREQVGEILMPPKYTRADFHSGVSWMHRGKLDVPKERFVLLPSAERGADSSPVVGWAGWDERDLARALAGRIMELREQEAADPDRLVPLLAGVLELLPWIHQWYPESDALYGGPPGQYFESWLDGQLAELAVTRDTLRSWRPSTPVRGKRA